jgi:hypothetical protein
MQTLFAYANEKAQILKWDSSIWVVSCTVRVTRMKNILFKTGIWQENAKGRRVEELGTGCSRPREHICPDRESIAAQWENAPPLIS